MKNLFAGRGEAFRDKLNGTLVLALVLLCATVVACSDSDSSAGADSGRADATVADAADSATGDSAAAKPPVELTPDLCKDASKMALLLSALGQGGSEPTYGKVDQQQVMRMAQNPTAGPFYMVNLIRYRDKAKYPDGRKSDLTGREANALYTPIEFLTAIGARIVFNGSVEDTKLGKDGDWHDVGIVEYPCPLALFAMSAHPEFQARSVHKDAGVEKSIVMVTNLVPLGNVTPPTSPYPPSASDPAFELVSVIRHRDKAQYGAGSSEPARTGQEAMKLYASSVADAEKSVGVYAKARLEVQGVFIGDGRAFDEIWIDHVPSGAAYDALAKDAAVIAADKHRQAALEHGWVLAVAPLISSLPTGAP